MLCFRCPSESFTEKTVEIVQSSRDFPEKEYKIFSEVMECNLCGWQQFGSGQVDKFLKLCKEVLKQQ